MLSFQLLLCLLSAAEVETAGGLQPPVLLESVEATYPARALAERLEATVKMVWTLDAEGKVTEVEVTEPAGDEFEKAAKEAAPGFRFQPARLDGQPVAVRIAYALAFRLPPPPQAPPAPLEEEAPPPSAGAGMTVLESKVSGESEARKRHHSAEAVRVIETVKAKRESADLGEVLARTQGITVQRQGGLGSPSRFSLNGLMDEQIRFFLDGVPLELAGYPFGVSNVPVNLVDRVEIYGGVVPVRFGVDALAGAVNLVSDKSRERFASASYEVGSFQTHRVSVTGRNTFLPHGVFVGGAGFLDTTRNNYLIDARVPDERGRLSDVRVERFHDRYRAAGLSAELGVRGKRWADRFWVRPYFTAYDSQFQHNVRMTVPYGQAFYRQTQAGALTQYEHAVSSTVSTQVGGGFVYTRGNFVDLAECVYDWLGQCASARSTLGETDIRPHDTLLLERVGFARANVEWRARDGHTLRLNVSPTWVRRWGDERRQTVPTERDPLNSPRSLVSFTNGLEHQLDLLGRRLENIALAKYYFQALRSEDELPGGLVVRRDRDTHRYGVGDSLRFRFTPWLTGKASYEWATRLPGPVEVFGDNAFTLPNLELKPETSHNVNAGLAVDSERLPSGRWRSLLNGFLREADDMILALPNLRDQRYENIYAARSLGAEGAVGWTSPGEWLWLDLNGTYIDLRNRSTSGAFASFEGVRIPNQPYLFGTGTAELRFSSLFSSGDQLSLSWTARYVSSFFLSWESLGTHKSSTPAQLVHASSLGYVFRGTAGALSLNVDLQNLTDARVFDFFGVQRPGRAVYLKTTADF